MKTFLLVFVAFFLLKINVIAQSSNKLNQSITYSLCEAEYNKCTNKCSVILSKGKTIAIGSYIKIYFGDELLTEGYILKHISGSVFILKDPNDANDPNVSGGCIGEAYSINISKKQIWGC